MAGNNVDDQELLNRGLKGVRMFKKEDIKINVRIGSGSFGDVFNGIILETQDIVAIKQADHERGQDALVLEARYLSKLQHPNIVKFYGVCFSPFLLINEYINGYTLFDLVNNKNSFSYGISSGLSWASQCAKGVEYLHSRIPKPIIHRDLKSLNLVVNWAGTELKIIDFGSATDIHTIMTNNIGTPIWIAPEVFSSQTYTEKCDVYSFGIILWEIFYREIPFKEYGYNCLELQMKIYKGLRPTIRNIGSPGVQRLIQKCWVDEPSLRPTIDKVVLYLESISKNHFVDEADFKHLYDCTQTSFIRSGYSNRVSIQSLHSLNVPKPKSQDVPEPIQPDEQNPQAFQTYKKQAMELLEFHNVSEHLRPVTPDTIDPESFKRYKEHTELAVEVSQLILKTNIVQQQIEKLKLPDIS